ncbi:putative restriction endonuclease [Actinoplanes missouriensis 431]|uniref:Putative restriction endonuclease n=1 Tax=Actinoplanes missouriensis (strain ATCC 14538 / DSM 43046 / CBS 188.64 / JCM 3121 / NBRC 102363 / NCIMB 12654 / NRRL B-3342 / UNCC 431) TaxID=512565 RepID=I0GZ28_ACTM4|nr:restriction endonuclease [Actinoplanes missouriensis]BAL86015.1 putative restriction endonuclease [Actinoplanes missouriensis 431]
MARRKGLIAQMIDARKQAKKLEAQAEARRHRELIAEQKRQQAEADREAKQAEAAAKKAEAAAKKAEAARLRQEVQAQRLADQAATKAAREAAQRAQAEERRRNAETRAKAQEAAAAKRLADQEEHARKIAEAEFRTEAVTARFAEFAKLLMHRNRRAADATVELSATLSNGGPDPFVERLQHVLAQSRYPEGLTGKAAAHYDAASRELLIEYELPLQDAVPTVVAYRYTKAKGMTAVPRKEPETKKLYGDLLARLTLRTIAEAFDATAPDLVAGVVFNGYVSTKDKATGRAIRPLLISIDAERDRFAEIELDEPELDPVLCLRSHLNAIVSPHPYDLEAVRPVVSFDLSKYKFVDEMDVVAGMDSRTDLLTLSPGEFEHLIRRLFEAIGMKSWVTQASKDEGVDGVAINEDPIVGGLCIIQAKRYSKIVGLEAVHALAGVMDHKRAAKGVLVTTSWVGKASRDFAAANGRIQIIEGRNLKHMLKEHLNLDVLIGLPKLPPGWQQSDVT